MIFSFVIFLPRSSSICALLADRSFIRISIFCIFFSIFARSISFRVKIKAFVSCSASSCAWHILASMLRKLFSLVAMFVIVYRVLCGDFPSAQKLIDGVRNRKFKRILVLARFMATAFPLAVANIVVVFSCRRPPSYCRHSSRKRLFPFKMYGSTAEFAPAKILFFSSRFCTAAKVALPIMAGYVWSQTRVPCIQSPVYLQLLNQFSNVRYVNGLPLYRTCRLFNCVFHNDFITNRTRNIIAVKILLLNFVVK